jgi:hypothetical protein
MMENLERTDTVPIISKVGDLIRIEKEISIHDSVGKFINGELVIKGTLIKKHKDNPDIRVTLDYIIETTSQYFGAKLSGDTIRLMVETIINKYPFETLEDFILIFKELREGSHKYYGSFTFPWIAEYIKIYLEKKYTLKENLKPEGHSNDWKTREEYLEAVRIGDLINKENLKRKEDGENYGKFKADYIGKRLQQDIKKNQTP